MNLMKKHLDSGFTGSLEDSEGLGGHRLVVSGYVDDFYEGLLEVIDDVSSVEFKSCVFRTDSDLVRSIDVLVSNSIRDLYFDNCIFEESILGITNNRYVQFVKKIEVINTKLDLGLLIILNKLTKEAGIEFLYTDDKNLYDLSDFSWDQLGGVNLSKEVFSFRLGSVLPYATYFKGTGGLELFLAKNSHLRCLSFGSDLSFSELQNLLRQVEVSNGVLERLLLPMYQFTFSPTELNLLDRVLCKGIKVGVGADQYEKLLQNISVSNRDMLECL